MVCNRQTQDSYAQQKNFYHIVNQIQRVHAERPYLRLGQLLTIAAKEAGWEENDLFYIPDDVLFKGLRKITGL